MRKIRTLGLTVLTGTLLAFGSPIAAQAVPSTTPNADAFCAAGNVPATVTNLTTQLGTQTVAHAAALADVVVKNLAVTAATTDLSNAVLAHITAMDGTDTNAQAIALSTYNVRSAAFGTAVASWLDAHIAEVNSNNSVLGSTFLLNYLTQVSGLVC